MKAIKYFSAFIIMFAIINGCKKTDDDVQATMTINPVQKDIENINGSFNIAVTSTTQWSVSCDKSWINLDPMTGSGNATIKADYQANSSSGSRTASIVFKGVGVEDRILSVTQSGIMPILTVTPANQSVAAVAGSSTINITSNLSWSATSNQTWCTLAQSSGIGNATLTINYQANTLQETRTAILTFTANGVTNQTVQVTQAEFVPSLIVSPASQSVNSALGTAFYNISSNLVWSATCAQDWITIANPSGYYDGTLSINYSQNATSGTRVATIVVSANGVSDQTVTLTQTNLVPTLNVTPANRDVSSAAGNTTFDITSNAAWTAESNQPWCTITNTSGNGNATINVNFEENTTDIQRVASVNISCNGLSPKIVTVTQQSVIPTEGLIAYYPFNGNANDVSGNGNNGIAVGTTLATDRHGNLNCSYSFNGNGDYIYGNCSSFPSGQRTISLWFNANSLSERPVLFAYGGNDCYESWIQSINIDGNSSYSVSRHCDGNYFTYSYPTEPIGQWIHWVIVNSVAGKRLFINGSLVASSPDFVNNTYINNRQFSIGVGVNLEGYPPFTNGSIGWFKGLIDDVRIYSRALTEQEIEQLYTE